MPWTVESLEPRHCPDVADLHLCCLRTHFSGLPGKKLLERYYLTLVQTPGSCGYVAESGGELVGFVCGVWDFGAVLRTLVGRFHLGLLVWGILQILNRPILLKRLLTSLTDFGKHSGSFHGYELRPIVVLPEVRGSGVAQELLQCLLADAKSRGYGKIFLRTESDNLAAQKFYEKNGFFKMTNAQDRYLIYEYNLEY